ncbi:hypothetical protein BGX29_003491 [Mortierella sp. GBA35]|nr:hypothetical protein BGX29_003491 [Mortierella sp. GBA35]
MAYNRNQSNQHGGSSRTGIDSRNTNTSRQPNGTLAKQNGHHPQAHSNQRHPGHQGEASSKALTVTSTTVVVGTGAATSAGTIVQQQEAWVKARQVYQQQLLTEHFGFSPLSFVDDVINSVNNMIYQASMALQEFVESEMEAWATQNEHLTEDLDIKVESAKCMHKFETLLEAAVDKNFDRFELYALKNLFGVPEDVDIVLPHYEALDFGISLEREEALDQELETLRQQVIMTKAMNYKLRKELRLEENRRRELERCREQIKFLQDALKEYRNVVPIPQTLIFIRDNIETLHRRFGSLHEKLQRNARAGRTDSSALSAEAAGSTRAGAAGGAWSDSIISSVHETLTSQKEDQRVMYIRSVVNRQIDEHCVPETVTMQRPQMFTAPPTPSPPGQA